MPSHVRPPSAAYVVRLRGLASQQIHFHVSGACADAAQREEAATKGFARKCRFGA